MTVVVNNTPAAAPGPAVGEATKPPERPAASSPDGAGGSKAGSTPSPEQAPAPAPAAPPGKPSEPAASTAPKTAEPNTAGAQEAKKAEKPKVPLMDRVPEHVAAMLCYLLGWITGLGFLLADRRPFVRFHAAQSVAVFGGLTVLWLVLSDVFLASFFPEAGGGLLVARRVVELGWIAATLVLMLKANSGERYRVALAGSFADRAEHAGK